MVRITPCVPGELPFPPGCQWNSDLLLGYLLQHQSVVRDASLCLLCHWPFLYCFLGSHLLFSFQLIHLRVFKSVLILVYYPEMSSIIRVESLTFGCLIHSHLIFCCILRSWDLIHSTNITPSFARTIYWKIHLSSVLVLYK